MQSPFPWAANGPGSAAELTVLGGTERQVDRLPAVCEVCAGLEGPGAPEGGQQGHLL